MNLNRNEKAIKFFDKAIELNPNYSAAYTNKGNTLKNLHKNQKAFKCCNKAIENI